LKRGTGAARRPAARLSCGPLAKRRPPLGGLLGLGLVEEVELDDVVVAL
jgi:hypothetical protein